MHSKVIILALLIAIGSGTAASAQMMVGDRFALQAACGEAVKKYCPKADIGNINQLWACLSPYFGRINPYCKATIQHLQIR